MSTTEDTDRLTLESGLTVRPWAEGDDLALLQVWGDAENPMQHQDRALLRPSSNEPWSRCIVAEDQGVPVAAATILRSSLHPDRLSFYAEVAPEHRRREIAAEMLAILDVEAQNSDARGIKARCAKRSAAQCFLKDTGFSKIQTSRRVIVEAGSIPLPDLQEAGLDMTEIATGSVQLSQLVAEFYNSVHHWDRAEMTVGKAQQLLLDDSTGASGAVVLRGVSGDATIRAFAVSYTPERTENPADVLLGWDPELDDAQAEESVRALLAMLTARHPVELEIDDAMVPLARVVDELIDTGDADVDFKAVIYAR